MDNARLVDPMWVDPAAQLPEDQSYVLVTVREGTAFDKELSGTLGSDSVFEATFFDHWTWHPCFILSIDDSRYLTDEVIAWMPMPAPYKKEEIGIVEASEK